MEIEILSIYFLITNLSTYSIQVRSAFGILLSCIVQGSRKRAVVPLQPIYRRKRRKETIVTLLFLSL